MNVEQFVRVCLVLPLLMDPSCKDSQKASAAPCRTDLTASQQIQVRKLSCSAQEHVPGFTVFCIEILREDKQVAGICRSSGHPKTINDSSVIYSEGAYDSYLDIYYVICEFQRFSLQKEDTFDCKYSVTQANETPVTMPAKETVINMTIVACCVGQECTGPSSSTCGARDPTKSKHQNDTSDMRVQLGFRPVVQGPFEWLSFDRLTGPTTGVEYGNAKHDVGPVIRNFSNSNSEHDIGPVIYHYNVQSQRHALIAYFPVRYDCQQMDFMCRSIGPDCSTCQKTLTFRPQESLPCSRSSRAAHQTTSAIISVPWMVAIILGCVLLCVVIGGILLCCIRRRRTERRTETGHPQDQADSLM